MLRVARKLGRWFGGLKVRYKLMVLHNLFFLVLSACVYAGVMPVIENWAHEARSREERLASGEEVPAAAEFYGPLLQRIRFNVLLALAVTYCLGVLALEGLVMRFYIYRPLRILLGADEASRRGDTAGELIDESVILGDELGRLMSSRNATVHQLRQHERELEQALRRIEETAADLRQKNRLLETAKRNIADQDRLASLGLLAASLAHEINTPLAVLLGTVEKLAEAERDPATQERLQRILRVARRLQRITESMLDFARVRTDRFEPVGLSAIVDEAWELVSFDEKARQITFENLTSECDRVLGNADRLTQLFVNLLRNALLAISPGGSIRVSCEKLDGHLCVRVDDTGPGIPSDALPGIFEAFVTTRLDSRGTGLGLAVAEGIAHQHGGGIRASNLPEGGARLEVRLPASASVAGGTAGRAV